MVLLSCFHLYSRDPNNRIFLRRYRRGEGGRQNSVQGRYFRIMTHPLCLPTIHSVNSRNHGVLYNRPGQRAVFFQSARYRYLQRIIRIL